MILNQPTNATKNRANNVKVMQDIGGGFPMPCQTLNANVRVWRFDVFFLQGTRLPGFPPVLMRRRSALFLRGRTDRRVRNDGELLLTGEACWQGQEQLRYARPAWSES